MKENKLYRLFRSLGIGLLCGIFAWIGVRSIIWSYEKYQGYRNPIEPGRVMFLINHEGNPFEKHDTLFVKVLEVERNYVLYEQSIGKWKDTTSAHTGYIRHFIPVNKY